MKRVDEKLQGVARVVVLGAVILSPWLFGSAERWAYLLISYLVGVGVAAWLLSLVLGGRATVRAPLLTLCLMALLAYVAFQMLALPASFVERVSPLAAEAHLERRELFREAGIAAFLAPGAADGEPVLTVSASAAATRTSFWLLATYLGAFLVMANTFRDWRQVRRAAAAVVVSSVLLAVLALVQHFSGTTALYGFRRPRFGGAVFGPFTNRNHFAAHMNMALGLTLGLLLLTLHTPGASVRRTWRGRLAWLSSQRACHLILLSFAALLTAATVCLTLSRGAMAGLAAGVCVMAVWLTLGAATRKLGRVIAALAVLVVAMVGVLAWEPVSQRLGTLSELVGGELLDRRMQATADTLRIFEASPLFGCGFGSFRHVFPAFQSDGIDRGRWQHAHNDYAELLAEGGAVGALLVAGAGLLFVWSVRSSLRKASVRPRLFVAGLAVGMIAIALHSAIDYSLHKPANALLLAALCGTALAVAQGSKEAAGGRLWSGAVRVGAIGGLAMLIVVFLRDPGELRGELALARFIHLEQVADQAELPGERAEAVRDAGAEADALLRLATGEPGALCDIAAACLWWSGEGQVAPTERLRLGERAARAAALAARRAPSDYEPWLWLARAQASLGLEPQARLCMARALHLAPPDVRREVTPHATRPPRQRDDEADRARVAGGPRESDAGSWLGRLW